MDTRAMVRRIAALLAVLSIVLTGCKTGEDLVFPNQGMQQNPW
jgi:hypothetical protein